MAGVIDEFSMAAVTITIEWVVETTNISFTKFWRMAGPRSR